MSYEEIEKSLSELTEALKYIERNKYSNHNTKQYIKVISEKINFFTENNIKLSSLEVENGQMILQTLIKQFSDLSKDKNVPTSLKAEYLKSLNSVLDASNNHINSDLYGKRPMDYAKEYNSSALQDILRNKNKITVILDLEYTMVDFSMSTREFYMKKYAEDKNIALSSLIEGGVAINGKFLEKSVKPEVELSLSQEEISKFAQEIWLYDDETKKKYSNLDERFPQKENQIELIRKMIGLGIKVVIPVKCLNYDINCYMLKQLGFNEEDITKIDIFADNRSPLGKYKTRIIEAVKTQYGSNKIILIDDDFSAYANNIDIIDGFIRCAKTSISTTSTGNYMPEADRKIIGDLDNLYEGDFSELTPPDYYY